MKNLILLFLFGILSFDGYAQDFILTNEGALLNVEIVRIGDDLSFYKENGKESIFSIKNEYVNFFKWNSKNSINPKVVDYKSLNRIVTTDEAGNTIIIQRNDPPQGAKNVAIVFTVISLMFTVIAFNGNNEGYDALAYLFVGAMAGIIAIVSGLVQLAMSARGGTKYEIRKNNDLGFAPFSQETISLLGKEYTKNAYLGFATKGVGVSLNF